MAGLNKLNNNKLYYLRSLFLNYGKFKNLFFTVFMQKPFKNRFFKRYISKKICIDLINLFLKYLTFNPNLVKKKKK